MINVIHSTSYVSRSASLGRVSVVLANAVLNAESEIGENVIVNTGAIVEHDCLVGDHCHIASGAVLGGGRCTQVGYVSSARDNVVVALAQNGDSMRARIVSSPARACQFGRSKLETRRVVADVASGPPSRVIPRFLPTRVDRGLRPLFRSRLRRNGGGSR